MSDTGNAKNVRYYSLAICIGKEDIEGMKKARKYPNYKADILINIDGFRCEMSYEEFIKRIKGE